MTYNNEILISIIIPTHNRLHYLQEALESALNQTYSNIEVIICDNASTDETYNFFRDYKNLKVIYHRHENLIYPLDNWNSWVNVARGQFVTFLPDDDKLAPTFIEKCFHEFSDDNISLVKAGCYVINEKSEITSYYLPFKDSSTSGLQYVLDRLNPRYSEVSLGSGYLFRKEDFVKLGGFLEIGFPKMHFVDDYLWFRIVLNGKYVKYINEKLWYYRDHASNMAIVEDIQGFKNSFTIYVPILLQLLKNQISSSHDIVSFVENEYADKIVKDRILGELSKNRRRKLSRSIRFLYKNRKIIVEYFGNKRIVSEFLLSVLSRFYGRL
tara:strand:- start:412 stop:1386 length:975 start_codon:yes stop_codon:yes gene_type:complete